MAGEAVGAYSTADLPGSVKSIYEEARAVANASPRSAAALLRVCLEELVNELEPGANRLNDKVGKLVTRGLPEPVTRAMDTRRVFGNEAGAHVGEIDLTDDGETVLALFQVLGWSLSTSSRDRTNSMRFTAASLKESSMPLLVGMPRGRSGYSIRTMTDARSRRGEGSDLPMTARRHSTYATL